MDGVVHAGDFTGEGVYRFLSQSSPLYAVSGNMDLPPLHRLLPGERVLEIEGIRIGLMHGYGSPHHTLQLVRTKFSDVDLVIFGHTHQPLYSRQGRLALLNPGSPTDKRWAPYRSYALLEINSGEFRSEIVKLPF